MAAEAGNSFIFGFTAVIHGRHDCHQDSNIGRLKGVTKHRTVHTGPKYSDILHWISSKSNKMQVRNAWKP